SLPASCMSFGFGVGDFIAVGTLAWKVYKNVYKAAKDAPESFQKVHHDVLSLHAVLKEAGEIVFDQPISLQRQQSLQTIADGCTSVLSDLEALVLKYEEMGSQGKLTWKRLRWGSEDIVEYRLRITSSILSSGKILQLLSTSRYVTEQKLEKYLREIQRGGREGSIISVQTVDSLSTEDRAVWRAIRKDLESIGITAAAYEANHDFIRDWLIRVLDAGALDEQATFIKYEDQIIQQGSSNHTKPSDLVPDSNTTYRPKLEGKSPFGNSPSGKASDPEPEGEALPKVHAKSLAARKADFQGHVLKISVTAISRFFQMYKGISTPNDRLLFLVHSGLEDSSQIASILQNPAKRRKVDAETIKEVFSTATLRGCCDTVIELLNDGHPVDDVIYPREGARALMLAALGGAIATIQLLLRWGANVHFEGSHSPDVQKRDFYKLPVMLTPLGCACAARQGHYSEEVVRMLLDAGADPRQILHGRSALYEASSAEVVRQLLVHGVDIHQVCESEGTPFMVAIRRRPWDVVNLLIREGARATDINLPSAAEGYRTPLEVAMRGFPLHQPELSKRLKPSKRNHDAWSEDIAVIDLLVENGAVMSSAQSAVYKWYRKMLRSTRSQPLPPTS
ncbi:MAG: hypothetical protein Q9204_005852, partial [Flavoplaca sp. TL-2023a]